MYWKVPRIAPSWVRLACVGDAVRLDVRPVLEAAECCVDARAEDAVEGT